MTDELHQDDLDTQLLAAMLADFLEESAEHLSVLDHSLVLLEQDPNNSEHLEEIFRRIHTVKGTASFTGLNEISLIAHRMEDILSVARAGKASLDKSIFDLLFSGIAWLKKLRQAAIQKKSPPDAGPFLERLLTALAEIQGKEPADYGAFTPGAAAPKEIMAETLKIRVEKMDAIMNLAGELIISKNKLNQLTRESEDRQLAEMTSDIQRISVELHREILEARLVPIGSLFNLFHGIVRNFSAQRLKKARLLIRGGEALLDKKIRDVLYDPFIHIIRNSLDHGIETPEEREKAGKPPEGKIEIMAARKGGSIEIRVSDDGMGIDVDNLVSKAVGIGLITEARAETMSADEKLNLIFHHGFSTARQVTESSGRGVGMDVVKRNISDLRGIIRVDSEKGRGIVFTIQIPMSMSVSKTLVIRERDIHIAMPFESIVETALLHKEEMEPLFKNKERTLSFGGRGIPLITLPEIFQRGFHSPIKFSFKGDMDSDLAMIQQKIYDLRIMGGADFFPVIIIGLANQKMAVMVDELLGTQELIQKPLSEFTGPVRGVEGAAVLSDGSIALFLDVRSLFEYV
ncbi:MAG: chemotaxis protein CheA [Nitrospinae bacterium]|nr:chemotaxis protein CheA [Nitrospinota bacterium]